jgi:hypothetical protein
MLKIVFIVSWIIGTLFARYIPVKSMDTVTRRELRYEITDINYQNGNLRITGWGFMYMQQHFTNASTHDIFIQLENEFATHRYKASLLPIDQTQLLRYGSVPRCKDTEFYQQAMTCYYDYANVGFSVSIPLSDFVLERKYTAYLIIFGKKLNVYQKIPLYYPLDQPIKTKIDDIEFLSISNLKDTEISIISAHVFARSGPSTDYPIYAVGANCSSAYLNRAYFRENTTYANVLDRYFDGTNTYYMVSADPSVCFLSRRRIIEGKTIKPVWIVSSYVQYGGTPLVLTSRLINSAPWLEIIHPTISKNESFDYMDYIKAFDLEEGDLSHKINVISNSFENKAGVYSILFDVSDKYDVKATGIMYVTVVEPLNIPPTLFANNQSIIRYTNFDALDNVLAFDVEDGNITDRIAYTGDVDTSKLGEYIVCYHVTDSHGATAEKCVIVSVVSNVNNRIRFISNRAKNTAKYPWQYFGNILDRELLNKVPYLSKTIVY